VKIVNSQHHLVTILRLWQRELMVG